MKKRCMTTLALVAAISIPNLQMICADAQENTSAKLQIMSLREDGERCRFHEDEYHTNHEFVIFTTKDGFIENAKDNPCISVVKWSDYETEIKNEVPLTIMDVGTISKIPSDYLGDEALEAEYCYIVKTYPPYDTPYTACRELEMQHNEIIGAFMLEEMRSGLCYWNGTYNIGLKPELIGESDEEILSAYPEIFGDNSKLGLTKIGYSEWKEAYLNHADGSRTAFEITREAFEAANACYEENQDKLYYVDPEIIVEEQSISYRVIDPWEHVGDLNEDGTINSSDAAALLVASASIGSGNDSCLSEDQIQFADVDADGNINASDAALILAYSAAYGSGSTDVSLRDYMKR